MGSWINVNERLPENHVWVMAATPSGVFLSMACYCHNCCDGLTDNWSGWLLADSPHEEKRITHWQPLPEPPELK